MLLSDISVKRPVFASVISLILIIFGVVSFTRLSLREYPDIDPPIISIEVSYPGASANIVETKITQQIEDRVSGIEGIEYISSTSEDGRSRITLEFSIGRDIDSAANDVRDRVSGIADNLPEEASAPEIQKADSDGDVIVWYSLVSNNKSVTELTDYAERYLSEQFSILDGVSTVRIGGAQTYAMRIWLNRTEMAARNITVQDIEASLKSENIELPAGDIESGQRQFTLRLTRNFKNEQDFKNLVIAKGDNGYLVRLSDVARVNLGTVEDRVIFRGNGLPRVGLGLAKQSKANTIEVVNQADKLVERLNKNLPDDLRIEKSFDSSVFIRAAIHEVYLTFIYAILLVVIIIFLFLGKIGATIIPAITVPISLIASFTAIYAFGFSINILTLLALVLAIGIVVDDAIIVLENISRRIQHYGEPPLLAAYRGTREIGFAVLATTIVLIAVFVPIAFLEGDIGKLFREFALTMSITIGFSGLIALTLSPMMCSKILQERTSHKKNTISSYIDKFFIYVQKKYLKFLKLSIRHSGISILVFIFLLIVAVLVFLDLPREYTPREDRGAFNVMINGPEGATFAYMQDYMNEVEHRLLPYTKGGDLKTVIVRSPRGFGSSSFNTGMVITVMEDWKSRRSAWDVMNEIRKKLSDLPGVKVSVVMRQGFSLSAAKPVQFVIAGGTYEQLAGWRDILINKINADNPGFISLDWDYKETNPQFEIDINYDSAADLGVSITDIGTALETMMGTLKSTTFINDGEEYDVILEGERNELRDKDSLKNIYVRSSRTGTIIPLSSLVTITELADATALNRYNRQRAITIESDLADGYSLGEALQHLENLVRENLPENVVIDYKGQSQDLKFSGQSMIFVFVLGICIVFLVLAAQFESYLYPLVIIMTVPLAMVGGLIGLYLTGQSLNIYSQIGLLTLVGLAAKNGILIVEFVGQMRDRGTPMLRALLSSSKIRLRPILMTSLTAVAGAIPLMLSSGAGAETRSVIGIVIFFGVFSAMIFTIFIVPVAYHIIGRFGTSPHAVATKLKLQETASEKMVRPEGFEPPTQPL